jgi:hypothetical protein
VFVYSVFGFGTQLLRSELKITFGLRLTTLALLLTVAVSATSRSLGADKTVTRPNVLLIVVGEKRGRRKGDGGLFAFAPAICETDSSAVGLGGEWWSISDP